MAAPVGRGRGRREGGALRLEPTITWLGSFGPKVYDAPLEWFPLEERGRFVDGVELRPYDNRTDVWPRCNHNKLCVVQVYDGYDDGGRRFFRCPIGESYVDKGNCHYARWVDPINFQHTQDYIHYLKFKIFNLEQKVKGLEQDLKQATPYPWTVSLSPDPLCSDFWCKCPYHMKKNLPPPFPPSCSGGAGPSQSSGGDDGYDGASNSQYSQSQYY